MNGITIQFRWLLTALILAAAMAFPAKAWAVENHISTASETHNASKPQSGDGSESNPYEITTAAELYWFAALVNGDTSVAGVTAANTSACAKLTKDIVVNEDGDTSFSWTPINNYNGTFDGGSHTISGLNCVDESGNAGLFGTICAATIKNVGIINSYFKGGVSNASVCAENSMGIIISCYNTGTVGGGSNVGGICGINHDSGRIVSCYNTGTVTGGSYVGGICGMNYGGSHIQSCYNTGSVIGSGSVGGICGDNNKGSTLTSKPWAPIYDCYFDYNKSAIFAVGLCHNNTEGLITNVEGKSTEQFKSGEVAWLLNSGTTDGSQTWYQTLSDDNGDAAPVLTATGSNTVYQIKLLSCNGVTERGVAYSNSNEDVLDEHIESGAISYDPNKKIYYKGCQEEGCDYAFDYYADAAGDTEAVPNDDATAFTVAAIELNDTTAYGNLSEFTVTTLSYKRTFSDGYWQAVYVPFDINCSELPDNLELVVINNFHEYEQADGSCNVVLEVVHATAGTIPALTPCLIRMKTAPESAKETEITFTDVPFRAAADNYIDCFSRTRYYRFNGSFEEKSGFSADTDFVLSLGEMAKADEGSVVEPQRWYLTATDRNGSTTAVAKLNRITINVIGEGSVSGIDGIRVDTENVAPMREGIYDLMGRRLSKEPERGFYIKNGAKMLK
ncbi:MAG: hypothetical protein ACI4A8_02110 [Muribaculaceae bacterium]